MSAAARKLALMAILEAADSHMEPLHEMIACVNIAAEKDEDSTHAKSVIAQKLGSIAGRRWRIVPNDPSWLFRYALKPDYVDSSDWRAMFRIPHSLFSHMSSVLRPMIEASATKMREPISAEKRLAAFLMAASSCTYARVANQLGMGLTSVLDCVRVVPRAICQMFRSVLQLPNTEGELSTIMNGFQKIAGLPYCVGAVDGTHIPWRGCPSSQYYEYRCYKGFESLVLFAVSSADRKIIYADVGQPGVLGDSTIFERSVLHQMITSGKWLANIPSLYIGDIEVRPYLLGDCAFSLAKHMMKTCSKDELAANPTLHEWEKRASSTRKPVECTFGILKNRFSALKTGLRLKHEDDAVHFIVACMIVHNMCIDIGDKGNDFLILDDEDIYVGTEGTTEAKRIREALMQYAVRNS